MYVQLNCAIVDPDAKLEKLWSEGEFTEGPCLGPDGCIYFSDIGNRILKFDPASSKTIVFRDPSGRCDLTSLRLYKMYSQSRLSVHAGHWNFRIDVCVNYQDV